jgi:hypothetical protein
MARIAFVDHSFHRQTRSSGFLPELLSAAGHNVHHVWDDSWQGRPAPDWDEVADHDAIVMFQAQCQLPKRPLHRAHANVTYVPMLDQFGWWQGPRSKPHSLWHTFAGTKMLSFSQALHTTVTAMGIASHHARYHPPPLPHRHRDGMHGFLWVRKEDEVSWALVKRLLGEQNFDSLHIHLAHDPGTRVPLRPDDADIARHGITMSDWFDRRDDYFTVLDRANVFFAPRFSEGIGMSFLEAMSRSQCVIAPDLGTMNEYLIHGVNGLLYRPDAHAPLQIKDLPDLCLNACRTIAHGHEQWTSDLPRLVNFILTPHADLYPASRPSYAVRLKQKFLN